MQFLASLAIGALLGALSARTLFVGSWLSLVPWSVAGVALGYWAKGFRWMLVGGSYGFILLFVFMVAGYSGPASLARRVPFFCAIGLAGAIYGLVLGWFGKQLWLWRTRATRPAADAPGHSPATFSALGHRTQPA